MYEETENIMKLNTMKFNRIAALILALLAEVASSQCDPSAAVSMAGSWGTYEDYLFTHYQEVVVPLTLLQWVGNNAGQSVGCERFPDNCLYDSCAPLMWRGPDL